MKRLIFIFVLCGLLLPSAYGDFGDALLQVMSESGEEITVRFSSGDKYVGQVKNGKQHGQGTYTWANGNKYVGEWKDGKWHGDGIFYEHGGRTVGEFKMGHPWNAVVLSASGDFMGKFVNGAPQKQNDGLTNSQLMELLLLSNLLKRDNNASQRAYDWGRIFGGGGITRDTVITLASDIGLDIQEKRITRDDVYIADEVFFTGTAAEVTPVREVDGRVIGAGGRGPVTEKLQSQFFDCVYGRNTRHHDWLTYI